MQNNINPDSFYINTAVNKIPEIGLLGPNNIECECG